jgi:hypothetical protein
MYAGPELGLGSHDAQDTRHGPKSVLVACYSKVLSLAPGKLITL